MKRLLSVTLAATSLVGLAACSSGGKLSSIGAATTTTVTGGGTGSTTAGGGATGSTVSIPAIPGVSKECQAIYQAIAGATQAMAGGSQTAQAKAVFASLVNAVPASLKKDAQTFADAYSAYLDLLVKYQGDPTKAMSDPAVVAALTKLGSADVQAASAHLTSYIDSNCKA